MPLLVTTLPLVLGAKSVTSDVPAPNIRVLAVIAAIPVPPLATGSGVESVMAAAPIVPVSVGDADITTFPVPVMALDAKPFDPSLKTACEAVSEERIGWAVSVAMPVTANVPPIVALRD